MFVPVITKEMQLFPGGKQPLPTRIKNVRSRAQSLEDFAASAANRNGVSASTASVAVARARIAPNAQRQRNSQSVGSLPVNAQTLLASHAANGKSPPKSSSMRRPLDAIAEGVEMPSTAKKKANAACSNVSTPDLQSLKIRPSSSMSTASDAALDKAGQPSTSNSSPSSEKASGKGLIKWLKSTLNGNGKSKDNKENGAKADEGDDAEEPAPGAEIRPKEEPG